MKPRAYYNEFDPKAAAWLQELIKQGAIAPGDVDGRSIKDVRAADLAGYRHCHFFAGIGVWSYALHLARWPEDREVWTGSCPCQPFSAAGQRDGVDDERHLWPVFFDLIRERSPDVVFGEQVASKDGLGWLDGVCADMEGAGYAVGAIDSCAAGFGAPHIRQRIYWVGDTERSRLEGHCRYGTAGRQQEAPRSNAAASGCGSAWGAFDTLRCSDGNRRIRPGSFPLVNGAPARVGRLRGYGNALVAPQAQAFIESYLDLVSNS